MNALSTNYVQHLETLILAEEFATALRYARMAVVLEPASAALWELAAHCADKLGEQDYAAQCWGRVIELKPAYAPGYNDLATSLERLDRQRDAELLYRAALRLDPEYATAHSNLAILLANTAREDEAERHFRRALALRPDFQRARLNLGQLLLKQGRYAEGWPLHEGRLLTPPGARRAAKAGARCTQWQGEALAGKSLLILPEQGLGDEIQFCRYVPWLRTRGVARVTLACWPQQTTLMCSLAGTDRVIAIDEVESHIAGHDHWTFLLSLPLHAGTELASIPADIPYLFPDAARVAACAPLFAGTRRRVGIVWRGNPRHENDTERSLPDIQTLAPLWNVPGVRFFSLQKSPLALPPWPAAQPVVDLAPGIVDCADTAALVSQLDLLVSVDTSVAHLAGALGIPCWILLPAHKSDWRWLRERNDSPWYPRSRLFRQPRRGDWQTPVAALAAALAEWARRPPSARVVPRGTITPIP